MTIREGSSKRRNVNVGMGLCVRLTVSTESGQEHFRVHRAAGVPVPSTLRAQVDSRCGRLQEADAVNEDFHGRIELDVRDSVADWTPYELKKAPEGAPNVLVVL